MIKMIVRVFVVIINCKYHLNNAMIKTLKLLMDVSNVNMIVRKNVLIV